MKPRLYLETTIPSYLTARPSVNMTTASRQKLTYDWWRLCRSEYELCTSAAVWDEAAQGDIIYAGKRLEVLESIPLLDTTEQVLALTQALLAHIIPAKAAADAAHIAFCAAHSVDFLLTWNCRHIANANLFRRIEQACHRLKMCCPLICTPEQLLGEYNHEPEDL